MIPSLAKSHIPAKYRSYFLMPVTNMIRSAVDCQSESWPSPLLATMPRPQWLGMRPKRRRPMGVTYSPQTRLTLIESCVLLTPETGVHCVVEKAPIGV